MIALKAAEIRAVASHLAERRDHDAGIDLIFLETYEIDYEASHAAVDTQALTQALDYLVEYADYLAYTEGEGGS